MTVTRKPIRFFALAALAAMLLHNATAQETVSQASAGMETARHAGEGAYLPLKIRPSVTEPNAGQRVTEASPDKALPVCVPMPAWKLVCGSPSSSRSTTRMNLAAPHLDAARVARASY